MSKRTLISGRREYKAKYMGFMHFSYIIHIRSIVLYHKHECFIRIHTLKRDLRM
jgi:hypothetical protein